MPPGIRARYPMLQETPSADPRQRTAWNVRDSDATIVLVRDPSSVSPGTELTLLCAELVFERPVFVTRIDELESVHDARSWLERLTGAVPTFVVNIAGPRESEAPGIEREATKVLREILKRFR